MTAPPRPNRALIPAVSARSAELLGRCAGLDDFGRAYALDHLARCGNPVALALLADAIGAALAARMPAPAPPTDAIWQREGGGPWEDRGEGAYDRLSALAKRWRSESASAGVTADYRVLPLGQRPRDDRPGDAGWMAGAA